jgi:hypothetical protein
MGRYENLELPNGQLGPFAKPRRTAAVLEAISWPKGISQEAQIATKLFDYVDQDGYSWEILLSKPGKEAFRQVRTNPNDMLPRITRDGIEIPYGEAFAGIWNEIENISRTNDGKYAIDLIARFVVACAYMVCHEETMPGSGIWRISDSETMKRFYSDLEGRVRTTTYLQGNIPLRVFLNLIEAIALQEDVKYFTLNGGKFVGGQGRVNTLTTTAGVIHYLTGKKSISWLVGGLSRNPPGVLSITQDQLRQFFPPIP